MSQDLEALAKQLAPYISKELLHTPTFWGDPERLHVGEDVALINTFFNLSSGHVHIGNHSFFGNHCSCLTGKHYVNKKNKGRQHFPAEGNDIFIGEGVWIASHAVIIGPCKIGDHAVIASGAVVMPGEYEGGYLYAGVPAIPKKKINFEE